MREMFKSVFDADYQGYEVFLDKVLKPLFGDKLEVLPVAEDNPTGVSEEAMEKARIKKIARIANIAATFNRKPMEVFDITLEDRVDITRARVGIQQIIRRGLFIQTHAFMIFHAEHPAGENWRFSYALKLGSVGSMTDAKRYTYLFGQNMHCRTAIDRFAELANGEITDQKLLDAFNVEALSDEFFEEYRKKYAAFVKYITGKEFVKEKGKWVEKCGTPNAELMAQFRGDDKTVRDYVKKLMGRITFLHFLQKKGWMNWDVNYMQHLFEKSDKKDNFLEAVLEPLFFGVLNTKVCNRTKLFKERGWDFSLLDEWQDFPYLNGGLFEEDESDKLNVAFPESYFVDLFKFYARYNFTVDENDPDDAEVGIDPEMLGKIFENLLEDNKDKGAFYTPKEIVRYMCQESLTAYLVGKTGYDEELIRAFVIHPYDEVVNFDDKQQNNIYECLEKVKICDPAIGSGAFPMGLLNELVRCEEALLGEKEDDHQCRSGLKKYIIQNNIYGVDIEKGAIDIARLRFWLSIIVDEKEPSPLPNLDYKIMQGNSLLESYKKVDLSHLLTEEGMGDEMQGGLFADQDIIQDTREELAASLEAYFNCSDHEEKLRIQEDIRSVIKVQLSARNLNVDFGDIDIAANQEFFLWHTWFSDVFNRPSDCEKGFDIVIGNPPYIDSETMTLLGQEEMRDYIVKTYKYIKGNWDIYMAFMEQGLRLCPNGYLCFITPDKWLSRPFGAKFRECCMIPRMSSITHTGNHTFKSAMVDAIITLFKPISAVIAAYKFNEKGEPIHMNTVNSSSISKPFLIDSLFSPYLGLVNKIEASSKGRLDDFAQCEGACATHDAYELIPFVKEASGIVAPSTHLKVVNTGTLSKFFCRWGEKELTYLGNKILHPVVNITDFKQSFGTTYITKSLSKKIIFKGLNLLDGFIDYKREYLPAKTTLVICSESDEVLRLLCGIINSELAIFYIKAKYASSSFCGGITFTKDMINSLPIPDNQEWQERIVSIVSSIESSSFSNHKDELNSAVYKLYGLSNGDIDIIRNAN